MKTCCNHEECKGNEYCYIEAFARFYKEHNEELEKKGIDPNTKCWKDGSHVYQHVCLGFNGMAVHLYPDSTYYLEDTTGG